MKDNIKQLLENEDDKRRDLQFLIKMFKEKVEEDTSSIILKAYLYDAQIQLEELDITIQFLEHRVKELDASPL